MTKEEDDLMLDEENQSLALTEFEKNQVKAAKEGTPNIYAWMALSVVLLSRVSH